MKNYAIVFFISIASVSFASWQQIGNDIDGEAAGDSSGTSVAISADASTVAIGASGNNGNGDYAGHVRVYNLAFAQGITIADSTWTQLGSDIDGDPVGGGFGYRLDISSDGTIVAIAASYNPLGYVGVYQYDPTSADWTKIGSNIVGEDIDGFGQSVAISSDGTRVVIGAPFNNDFTGAVRVYEYDGINWIQLGSDIDGEATGNNSGGSIDISADGTIVVIGAQSNDDNGNNAGHARVYQYDPTTADWVQRGADIDGEAERDAFGTSVHLNNGGTVVAIGATGNDGNGDYAGHVRVMHTLPDSDGDGLVDYDELYAYGTATNNIDTDGDGWSDSFEVNLIYTFSATNNDSAIISSNSTVSSELEAAALLLTTNQAYAMLDDAYTEDIVMSVSNDIADIVMTLEQSTNLTVGAWTTNKFLTNSIPVDADAKFFRFRLAE